MIENNEKNREILSEQLIDGMDFEDLRQCAIGYLLNLYEFDNKIFNDDWKDYFGESND